MTQLKKLNKTSNTCVGTAPEPQDNFTCKYWHTAAFVPISANMALIVTENDTKVDDFAHTLYIECTHRNLCNRGKFFFTAESFFFNVSLNIQYTLYIILTQTKHLHGAQEYLYCNDFVIATQAANLFEIMHMYVT